MSPTTTIATLIESLLRLPQAWSVVTNPDGSLSIISYGGHSVDVVDNKITEREFYDALDTGTDVS